MVFVNPSPQQPRAQKSRYPRFSILIKSALVSALIVGAIAGAMMLSSGTSLLAQSQNDHFSDAERQTRLNAFNALGALPMNVVPTADVPAALKSMHLIPAMAAALSNQLTPNTFGDAPSNASQPAKNDDPSFAPAPTVAKDSAAVRLVWVTFWDSDVEDGDVVRIVSGGYSRTVTLTKRGDTFAIPVPVNGKVVIIGIRDGDGGGITVGLASGAAQAVLPIMSVGQVLPLNIKVN